MFSIRIILFCFVLFCRVRKEDAVERFERMQKNSLAVEHESVPYFTAQLKNDRRVMPKFNSRYESNE